jgi:hypothetical protein
MLNHDTQPDLPSLTVSALLVPLAFSSWLVRHSSIEAAAQPSWMDHDQRVDDNRPYLDAPHSDVLSDAVPIPSEEPDTYTSEFSFRAAWEVTRSVEHLPPAWRHIYRKYNRILSEDHDLSMSAGGAHRYARPHESVIRTPPTPATITHAMSAASAAGRASAMRSRLYRRLGIVRCPRTNRFARDPDSSWTSHAPLDRRIRWAQPA